MSMSIHTLKIQQNIFFKSLNSGNNVLNQIPVVLIEYKNIIPYIYILKIILNQNGH